MPLSGEQIRLRGLAALRRELGRAGLVRFLQHFKPGAGNYTRERQKFLAGLTMDELRGRVGRSRKKKSRPRA
ncbi:MAG: hypothetical protein ABSB74_21040 [Tepidisphaeraceae bacterium]